MKPIAEIGAAVIDHILEIGYGFGPLLTEQIHFSAQRQGRSFRGPPPVGVIPFHRKMIYRIIQVLKDMAAQLILAAPRGVQRGKFLIDIAAFIVIRHSAPAIEHSEISHRP